MSTFNSAIDSLPPLGIASHAFTTKFKSHLVHITRVGADHPQVVELKIVIGDVQKSSVGSGQKFSGLWGPPVARGGRFLPSPAEVATGGARGRLVPLPTAR